MKKIDISKRSVLKGFVGLTTSAVVLNTFAHDNNECNNNITFDETWDLVIIGSGFAATTAAIEAYKLGIKKIKIIEKMPVFGGNSAINGGVIAFPNNPVQIKAGIKDSPELLVQDQIKAGRGLADKELLTAIANASKDIYDLTISLGVKYQDRCLHMGGHSVARSLNLLNQSGSDVVKPFLAHCKKIGVNLERFCFMEKLIQNDKNEVIGVEVKRNYDYKNPDNKGNSVKLRSKYGVLVCSGGFAANVTLRQAEDPMLDSNMGTTNHAGATGEAMMEMFRLGAVPTHLSFIQSGPWTSPDENGFGINPLLTGITFPFAAAIDIRTGRRFMNELADRKTRADSILKLRDAHGKPVPPFLISNYDLAHSIRAQIVDLSIDKKVAHKFNTLKEVASFYHVPLAEMQKQIDEYNSYYTNGTDLQFGKNMKTEKNSPIVAPYLCSRLWPKVHYTQGGVKINHKAQVIDFKTNKPIVGLYAAGEVCGGIHGQSRLGSTSALEALCMGLVSARTIVSVGEIV